MRIVKNKILDRLPYIKRLSRELNDYKRNCYVPPGHFYSPIISIVEVRKRENQLFGRAEQSLPGIDLNENFQMQLLETVKAYYHDLPFQANSNQNFRFYYENKYFTYADAISLSCIIRHFKPKRIIEVGSGFSSAAMLDLNEIYFDGKIELTFIEPYPDNRFNKLVKGSDQYKLIEKYLQDVELSVFEQLKKDDILFIDSSHVVKTGSEVNYFVFEILPVLKPGVIVHFHDIFYPFEYPKEWAEEKRSWNEAYFLRAFLMHNKAYEIIMYNSFLQAFKHGWFETNMALFLKDKGSSLWLVKF